LWKSFDANIQLEIRTAALQCLVKEREKVVQHAVMEIIGTIAKEELSVGKHWPELMTFIQTIIQNENAKQKEVCMAFST